MTNQVADLLSEHGLNIDIHGHVFNFVPFFLNLATLVDVATVHFSRGF